ncbi:MAG: signal peptidase I [Treponemataceae bacterium]|nr:signal peptidase I [Treponemataceae bacterium]
MSCRQNNKEKKIPFILILLVVIVLSILAKIFIFDLVRISGTSMEPTLKNTQMVLVNKLAYGIVKPFTSEFIIQWKKPETNDVVIFLHDNKMTVKRVVAKENFPLEFYADSEYSLKIDEKLIPLTESQYQKLADYSTVPENMVLAIGDNYSTSIDSRDFGFVSVKNIVGKVVCK